MKPAPAIASNTRHCPVVLAIGGHDPSGGAGIMADADAIRAFRCWPVTLVTTLTSQNSYQLINHYPQTETAFAEQLQTLTSEIRPDCVKTGVLGSLAIQQILAEWLAAYPRLPLVIDPVISSTSGASLMTTAQMSHLLEVLLPRTTLLTPNLLELHLLVPGQASIETKVQRLLQKGCKAVLLKGTHASSHKMVRNQLFTLTASPGISRWERLPHEYHGSGCTLAAAIAALLAQGKTLEQASIQAQDFTWRSLKHALKLGRGNYLPLRDKGRQHV